jgi:hypothetical protein
MTGISILLSALQGPLRFAALQFLQASAVGPNIPGMSVWSELSKVLLAPIIAGVAAALATNYFSARFSFARFRR